MSYEIGTRIDLSGVNKHPVRRTADSAGSFLVEVGTRFIFRLSESGYKAARIVPVSFA